MGRLYTTPLKTICELEKLPTKRLLAYYKTLHKLGGRFEDDYFDCDCEDCKPFHDFDKYKYKVKELLDTREHVS